VVDHRDLESALAIISAAKADADLVVAAFHWGVHFTHDLAIYQPDVAYAAIDAGADVVIGTHPHCLQAVDVYQGKFIFYSLGNFAFEQPERIARHGVGEYLSFYGLPVDDLPQHPHPTHCRKTMIVKLEVVGSDVISARLVPTYFNDDAQPEPLDVDSALFEEVAGLIEELSEEIGTTIERVDGELRVVPAKRLDLDTRVWVRERGPSYPWLGRLIAGMESRASSAAAQ
jgi:capsule synthesis protein PGA_cap